METSRENAANRESGTRLIEFLSLLDEADSDPGSSGGDREQTGRIVSDFCASAASEDIAGGEEERIS
jgi:hypothetical protein